MAMGKELIQLMQNVFTEFRFDTTSTWRIPERRMGERLPAVGGERSPAERIWPAIKTDYNPIFRAFVDKMRESGRIDVPPPR